MSFRQMALNTLVVLCGLVLVICDAQSGLKTGLYFGPQGQWQSKASELESSLNRVKNAQSADQQRLATMSKVFSDQITALDGDVKATKTVLSVLLNGSVTTKRKLRELEGMKTGISNLRAQLTRIHSGLSSFLAKLDHSVNELDKKVQDQMHAQETINGQNKDKMSQLSNRIDGLGDKNAGQDAKLSVLENMMQKLNQTISHQSTFVSGETVMGTIRELSETVRALTSRLDSRDSLVNRQMLNLRNDIEEVKRERRRNAAYPHQK